MHYVTPEMVAHARIDSEFLCRIEALGDDASVQQQSRLVEWVIYNYGADFLDWCADQCLYAGLGDAYSDLRMRASEF
jgi:hypothetical protein